MQVEDPPARRVDRSPQGWAQSHRFLLGLLFSPRQRLPGPAACGPDFRPTARSAGASSRPACRQAGEGNDLEVGAASRTAKRIHFVHLLDERGLPVQVRTQTGPAFAGLSCRGRSKFHRTLYTVTSLSASWACTTLCLFATKTLPPAWRAGRGRISQPRSARRGRRRWRPARDRVHGRTRSRRRGRSRQRPSQSSGTSCRTSRLPSRNPWR